jgi:DNA-binding HxlR family transcriptional regulator
MIREAIQNIGQKIVGQRSASEQEPRDTIFFERIGVVVKSPVNGAICRSLHSEPSEIETLTKSVNDIFKQVGTLETPQDIPVKQKTIRKRLGELSNYGIVEQKQEEEWSLTKSGKEVVEHLLGEPRTEEQKLIDIAELIGIEALNLRSSDLRTFVQQFRGFLPIIKASANRDTVGPFSYSSDGELVEETTRNLRRAWKNFKASSGGTGHPD